jgi:hypothetical protein
VIYDGKPVARVAFKFAASGLTTYAYVHWLGVPMKRGRACGGGYDKSSAAVTDAMCRYTDRDNLAGPDHESFIGCLLKDDGQHWDNRLRAAGFNVFQVV